MKIHITIWSLAAMIPFMVSCATQNLFESTGNEDLTQLREEGQDYQHVIKPDDKVSLSIWNHDDMSFGSVYSIYNSNETFGKWLLVNDSGTVNLPKIGETKIAGMTCQQATIMLTERYKEYLVKPVVAIKVLNKRVNVLGEVRLPGSYITEEERITLATCLSFAQGMTDQAELSSVQLIRGSENYLIDMQKEGIEAHDIVMMDGDIIHIPSKKGKRFKQSAPTIIPFTSVVTALVLASTLIN